MTRGLSPVVLQLTWLEQEETDSPARGEPFALACSQWAVSLAQPGTLQMPKKNLLPRAAPQAGEGHVVSSAAGSVISPFPKP